MADEERGSFSGGVGFVLTAAGAAVGLGCIWRFPYLAAEYGGGVFILCYLALLIILGLTLLMTEVAIGKKTKTGVLDAFTKLNSKFKFLGIICLLVPLLVQPYYSVLGAYITKYGFMFATGQGSVLAEPGYYQSFIASLDPLVWVIGFVIVTGLIVLAGVRNGLERTCKILLVIEAVLLTILAACCLTLPGAFEGLGAFLIPNPADFTGEAVLAAMGQVFYSLSLGFGIMLTFGTYIHNKVNIAKTALTTVSCTFIISIIAGILIIPASYVFTNGNPGTLGSGQIFETLPSMLATMPFGELIGAVFFLILSFAALTSNIAALEVMVAAFKDKYGITRAKGVVLMTIYTLVFAIPVALGYGVLDWINVSGMYLLEIFDFVSGTVLLPIVAFITCILVGYFVKPDVIPDEIGYTKGGKARKIYLMMVRYFSPACIVLIVLYSVVTMLI